MPAESPERKSKAGTTIPEPAELARRINRLFDVMHARRDPPQTTSAAAAAITERGPVQLDAEALDALRAGHNPGATVPELNALADHFGVTAAYLTDAGTDPTVDAQLNLLRTLRDNGVGKIISVHACTRPHHS